MELVAVIMAGGVGARFWPKSRAKEPKQLLNLFSEGSMIQNTVDRMKGVVKNENIYVVTNKIQKEKIVEQLSEIPTENIIEEPYGKNTAAAIGLASIIINKNHGNAVTIVLPADHLINDLGEFQRVIKEAADFAQAEGSLVTIGINPTRPDTGFGYIQIDENETETLHKVLRFAEKPNLDTAKRFLESGDFFWNSGMFVWRADVILNEIKSHMIDLDEGLQIITESLGTNDYEEVLTKIYGQLKSVSIDYGIMENSKNVRLIKGKFDWSDVGSWDAVYHLLEKDKNENAAKGEVYFGSSSGTYVNSENKFTAVIGVKDLLVINTDDATLVCHRDYAQDVKLIVDYLKMNKKDELL
ncbi:MAG: mannose-1-phosphate guanylyltransferase [Melioribacteraceae bacterium]|jgi:mannose-1-phosphate guanylyltransferase|nr:mannose-1-phosphate guanylyltransferase [Melioribacteraceae bacterium]